MLCLQQLKRMLKLARYNGVITQRDKIALEALKLFPIMVNDEDVSGHKRSSSDNGMPTTILGWHQAHLLFNPANGELVGRQLGQQNDLWEVTFKACYLEYAIDIGPAKP